MVFFQVYLKKIFRDCNNFFYNEMNGEEQKYFGGKANGFSSEIYENLLTKKGFSQKLSFPWKLEGEIWKQEGEICKICQLILKLYTLICKSVIPSIYKYEIHGVLLQFLDFQAST